MKVIIAGSRSITSPEHVSEAIQQSGFTVTEVVSGRAHGVDRMGEAWAERREILTMYFPAQWDLYGKQAGFRRNFQMGNYADAAIVIWDGKSRGARHMVFVMKSLKKPVFVYRPPAPVPKKMPESKWKPIQVPDGV